MKRNPWIFPRLIGLFLLASVLCGCSLGGRLLNPTETPALPQQNQPAAGVDTAPTARVELTSASATPAAAPTQAARATATPASASKADTAGQNLLNQINALNAANQAGDALEDLP